MIIFVIIPLLQRKYIEITIITFKIIQEVVFLVFTVHSCRRGAPKKI